MTKPVSNPTPVMPVGAASASTSAPAPSAFSITQIQFPPDLPVSERREEIMAAMRAHQVVIVCGETGSGKTTQLPKMALALGRGKVNGGGLIGHTQPRRVAAVNVARRLAQELKTAMGDVVGYTVRFDDKVSKSASVRVMTDGILLAQTQSDPLLKMYDTLIIDEAHERSLNIDFLLGYLRQLLPKRPDLKLIITSATIDAQRFAEHFGSPTQPAPVITVSGRLFEVEQRWRPFEEARDYGLNEAIADAVDELWQGRAQGDILVFLPGEREIRDATEHLRGHLSHSPVTRDAQLLPLYARLSQAQQDQVFMTHQSRRIVLATNVAETSLTVPGIRYVIDAGTARVKRYSFRNKVEQLQVEPISQAAANQRAGRCGRVAHGVCIRLYDEIDFSGRPRFTEPEILRSSLAGVILRMKALGLGDVEAFPFLDAPARRAVVDGYQLLQELGAVDEYQNLEPLGQQLSRLPLDPRIGRMIIEARQRQSLTEVLVIASALSVQDVRDRPLQAQAAADQAHAKFDDEKSEFLGYLKLWRWLEEGWGHASEEGATRKLSRKQYEQRLKDNFINARRVREWRDIHAQLHTVIREHNWRLNTEPATYEQLHMAMLSGLLGNVGCKSDEDETYLGARGIRFYKHPGAHLSKKPSRWIVAAELIDTTRLFARGIASIEPQWLEQVGAHLLKKQLLDPHWEKKAAEVVAYERATLYGLVVYNQRRVNFGRVDAAAARDIFIREGLVAQAWQPQWSGPNFWTENQKLLHQIQELEHKSRRQDVLVDDALIYAFYDQHLPPDVFSGMTLERWYRHARKEQPRLLYLSRDELMRHEAAGITTDAFPKTIKLGGVDCSASYWHEPGHAKDGVTVEIPLFVLNQVNGERCEWLVPGLLQEKVLTLLRSLPQRTRSRLVPLPASTEKMLADLPFAEGALLDALAKAVKARTGLEVARTDFKPETLPVHLWMNIRVVDEHGRQLGMGRNLGALKAELGTQARGAFQALAQLKASLPVAPQAQPAPMNAVAAKTVVASVTPTPAVATPDKRWTRWDFGPLEELMEIRQGQQSVVGFPALIDKGDAVTIEVFDEPDIAASKHRAGMRRLLALQLKDMLKQVEKNIPDFQKNAMLYASLGTAEELKAQIVGVALDRAFMQAPLPNDVASFERRIQEGRSRLGLMVQEIGRLAGVILAEYGTTIRKIKDTKNQATTVSDATQQLQRLMPPRFLEQTPYAQLQHFSRYLKAITLRLDKLRADPQRDAQRLAEIRPQEQRYWRLVSERQGVLDEPMMQMRWLLEELRVSLFAQELRTPQPVSVKRLEKVWTQIQH